VKLVTLAAHPSLPLFLWAPPHEKLALSPLFPPMRIERPITKLMTPPPVRHELRLPIKNITFAPLSRNLAAPSLWGAATESPSAAKMRQPRTQPCPIIRDFPGLAKGVFFPSSFRFSLICCSRSVTFFPWLHRKSPPSELSCIPVFFFFLLY